MNKQNILILKKEPVSAHDNMVTMVTKESEYTAKSIKNAILKTKMTFSFNVHNF